MSLLLATGVVVYWILTNWPKWVVERSVGQDRIAAAIEFAVTWYKDPRERKRLFDYVLELWEKRVEELAEQQDFRGAFRDAAFKYPAEAPSLDEDEQVKLEKRRENLEKYLCEWWSTRIGELADALDFGNAFQIWEQAPLTLPERDAGLEKLYKRWSSHIQGLANKNQFTEAIRVWREAPDSIKQTDPERWEKPKNDVRAAWSLCVRDLQNETKHKFRDAITTLKDGLPEWLNDAEGKNLVNEGLEHWSSDVQTFASNHEFPEAYQLFEQISPPWLSEEVGKRVEEVRKDVIKERKQWIDDLVGQDNFLEACNVVRKTADA